MGFEINRSAKAEWLPEEVDPRETAMDRVKQARNRLASIGSEVAVAILASQPNSGAPEHTAEYVTAEQAVENARDGLHRTLVNYQ